MGITKKDLHNLINQLDEHDTEKIYKLITVFQEPTRGEMMKQGEDHIAIQEEEEFTLSDEEKKQLASSKETIIQREDIENILRQHKQILVEQYHVSKIGLFGSYVRNEQTEKSDVDILVEFSRPLGLGFFDLKDYLESLFGKRVDLVSSKALKPYIKDNILREVRYQ
jgi:uncharacterized protein